jgi:hypothetical protein
VECLGWNGIKVHCREKLIELAKGEIYVSDTFDQPLLLDVQDTRVMLKWPGDIQRETFLTELEPSRLSESPSKTNVPFGSSPPALLADRLVSPISPIRALDFGQTFEATFHDEEEDDGVVKVYEDEVFDGDAPHDPTPVPGTPTPASKPLPPSPVANPLKRSHDTLSSELGEISEHDEENDPVILSFYDADNVMSRFQSFQHGSPQRPRKPLKASMNSPGHSFRHEVTSWSPVKNHVINQLAFSRIHSLPLSTIHSNLPAELRGAMAKPSDHENRRILTTSELKSILDETPCVGEISREGKDAAGKLLESEFYYVPEMDTDVNRRDTVTLSLGKTSIRAARKQHKVRLHRLLTWSMNNLINSSYSNTTGRSPAIRHVFVFAVFKKCLSAYILADSIHDTQSLRQHIASFTCLRTFAFLDASVGC